MQRHDTKLGDITINSKSVSVFRPPHDDPDFPWVDVQELAQAYLPEVEAARIVTMTHAFGGDTRACVSVKSGDRIATIICHAMAHGLVGMIDFKNGHRGELEEGPAHREYSIALGVFAADHWPMSFAEIKHAFKNPGGKFLQGVRSDPGVSGRKAPV